MEIRFEKDAEVIGDPQQQLDDFAKKMQDQQAEWVATLQENPDEFVRIEAEVQQAFAVGGGRWLAALMHLACQVPSADEPTERKENRPRAVAVRVAVVGHHLVCRAAAPQELGEDGTTGRPVSAIGRHGIWQRVFPRSAIHGGPDRGLESFDQGCPKGIETAGIEARLQNGASYRRATGDAVVGAASAGAVGLAGGPVAGGAGIGRMPRVGTDRRRSHPHAAQQSQRKAKARASHEVQDSLARA
jgi:hypothetical protein